MGETGRGISHRRAGIGMKGKTCRGQAAEPSGRGGRGQVVEGMRYWGSHRLMEARGRVASRERKGLRSKG